MKQTEHTSSPEKMLILFLVVLNTVIISTGFTEDPSWYWILFVTIPLVLIIIVNILQKKHHEKNKQTTGPARR